ncbi:MAG: hypothetical protein HY609_00550 [Deltaproteobacteria bacterium]|nr:hypothetical protein [Deltaproteobacteria bacterium]
MKNVVFFANLPDGTHCYQAALKMALAYFEQKERSFADLDRLTDKLKDKWTWPTASLIWLMENGFEIKLVEKFSYRDFAARGKDYLIEKCGREVADAQAFHSDLFREQALAKQFIEKGGTVDYRIPGLQDIEQSLKDEYLIICNINANCLYQRSGYSGHFVLPVEIGDQNIVIHDPGLPPAPSLKVPKTIFEKAWGYPAEEDKNLLAIRKSV